MTVIAAIVLMSSLVLWAGLAGNLLTLSASDPAGRGLFSLDLPKRPPASTEWSDWIPPVPAAGAPVTGLSLRYRFRLVPYGSDQP